MSGLNLEPKKSGRGQGQGAIVTVSGRGSTSYRMSWMATLWSLFLPQTVRELTNKMMNSPFSIPMETISPFGL